MSLTKDEVIKVLDSLAPYGLQNTLMSYLFNNPQNEEQVTFIKNDKIINKYRIVKNIGTHAGKKPINYLDEKLSTMKYDDIINTETDLSILDTQEYFILEDLCNNQNIDTMLHNSVTISEFNNLSLGEIRNAINEFSHIGKLGLTFIGEYHIVNIEPDFELYSKCSDSDYDIVEKITNTLKIENTNIVTDVTIDSIINESLSTEYELTSNDILSVYNSIKNKEIITDDEIRKVINYLNFKSSYEVYFIVRAFTEKEIYLTYSKFPEFKDIVKSASIVVKALRIYERILESTND